MGVVENDHYRCPSHGQLGDDPVQTVPDALRVRGGGTGLLSEQTNGRAGDLVPPAEYLATLGLGAGSEDGLQQLAYDMEGDGMLLLAASGRQYSAAAGSGDAPDLGQHGRLAQPGGSAEEQQPTLLAFAVPAACADPLHRIPSSDHLVLALVQGLTHPIASVHDGGPLGAVTFRHFIPPALPACWGA